MATLPTRVRPQTFETSRESRVRPLGSNFAQQSQTYFLYLPFLLGVVGAAVWALPTNFMFVVGALVGGSVGIYVLIDIVFRSLPLRITTIYGMTVLLSYNLGSFYTWLTIPRGNLTLAEAFAREPGSLGRAVAVCMVAAAILFATGELFERPIFGAEFCLTFGPGTLPVILLTTFLVLAAYATGRVGYGGGTVDEYGHIDPATQLTMWWFFPAYAYTVCAALNATGVARLIVGGMVVVQTIAMVPLGRRQFAFSLLLAMIASRLGRFRLRLPMYKRILLVTAAVVLVTAASVFFLYLRFAGWERGNANISTAERIESAFDLVSKKSPIEILELLGTNVSHRTFVLGFFSDLLEASQNSTPLLGKDLLYNLQSAVPSIISSDKFGVGAYGEETLANMQWGFSYRDEANSLITAGAADFGFLGVLFYPLAFCFLLRFAVEVAQYVVPLRLAVVLALAYVFQSLEAETVPLDYFLQIRSTILLAIIYYLLSRLPAFRAAPAA